MAREQSTTLLLRQVQKGCLPCSRQESATFHIYKAAWKITPEIMVEHSVRTAWRSTDVFVSEAEMVQKSQTLDVKSWEHSSYLFLSQSPLYV